MDFDGRTENLTPMEVRCLPMDDRQGRVVLVAIAKVSYAVSRNGVARLAHPPAQIRHAEEYFPDEVGGPFPAAGPFAAVRYPSDWVDDKPGTDVIVVGTARPPEGVALTEMDVSVRVGRLFKAVRVHGRRVFQASVFGGITPGPARLLGPTPLRYELAQGGHDDSDPERLTYDPKNPAGLGYAEARHKRVGAEAPRLSIPASLAEPGREPAGFGAMGASWSPRVELAGTRDEAWRRKRAPIAPADFDPRYNRVAHPDLQSATPLRPDEPVELLGLTPEQAWRFRLPDVEPRFSTRCDGEVREHETHLDTFLIDADARRVELVWRIAVPLPRKAQRLDRVTVRATGDLPPSILDLPFTEAA